MSRINATNNNKIYFFDSDVLIAAKNHHYNPSYAQIFWDWLLHGINYKVFKSAINVKKELLEGDDSDPLKLIIQNEQFDNFWVDTGSNEIVREYSKVQNWARIKWTAGKNNNSKDAANLDVALRDFASNKKADAWLVALASYTQLSTGKKAIICTNENSAPRSVKRVMLPDAAESQNIETINLFKLLRQHSETNFKFKMYE